VKTILDHSTEEYLSENLLDLNLQKKLDYLDIATATIGASLIKFFPLKVSSLIDPIILEYLTKFRGSSESFHEILATDTIMTDGLRKNLSNGMERLRKLCEHAKQLNIRILVDAEESHRQSGLELIFRELAKVYNHRGNDYPAVLFNTYQTYLLRTEMVLQEDIRFAEANNFTLAFKLVRGAYINSEIKRTKTTNIRTLQESKRETDNLYNKIVSNTLHYIQRSATNISSRGISHSDAPIIMIATHNKQSILYAIEIMEKLGIANDNQHVHFAQILGMSDNITFGLGLARYNVAKLVLFGELENIIPWFLRRLDENNVSFINSLQSLN